MICATCKRQGRKPEPGGTTSQTPGAPSCYAGFCDACGFTLARRWVANVRPGPKASDTVDDAGHFEILPFVE